MSNLRPYIKLYRSYLKLKARRSAATKIKSSTKPTATAIGRAIECVTTFAVLPQYYIDIEYVRSASPIQYMSTYVRYTHELFLKCVYAPNEFNGDGLCCGLWANRPSGFGSIAQLSHDTRCDYTALWFVALLARGSYCKSATSGCFVSIRSGRMWSKTVHTGPYLSIWIITIAWSLDRIQCE